jgi:hypothetical protein
MPGVCENLGSGPNNAPAWIGSIVNRRGFILHNRAAAPKPDRIVDPGTAVWKRAILKNWCALDLWPSTDPRESMQPHVAPGRCPYPPAVAILKVGQRRKIDA